MANWDVLHSESLEVEHGVPHAQVLEGLAEGRISRDDCVRKPGDDRWWHIYEVPEFRTNLPDEAVMEEPPHLEEDQSLRGLLAGAEPTQETRQRRPAPRPAAPKLQLPELPLAAVLDDPDEGLPYEKKRHEEQEELDMTPMVDVAMQLILFFMVTSSMILQACLEFPKPAPEDTGQAPRPEMKWEDFKVDNLTVEVKSDNMIYLDDAREATKESELAAKLQAIKRERAISSIVIRAHEEAFHERVVAVIDAANVAEIRQVKLAAMKKSQKKTSPTRRKIKNE